MIVRHVGLLGLAALLAGARAQDSTAAEPQAGAEPAPLRLGLDEALALALQNNYGLELEELATEIARFDYEGSWGAFDPVLSASASVLEIEPEASDTDFFVLEGQKSLSGGLTLPLVTGGELGLSLNGSEQDGTVIVPDPDNPGNTLPFPFSEASNTLTMSMRQPLRRGAGRRFATVDQREAELAYGLQRERRRQVRQELLLAVHDAYWNLVAAREELGVRRIALQLGHEQLEQNRRRLDVGVGTEVDVLQAETNVAAEEQLLLRAAVEVEGAQDALKALLFRRADETALDGYREWWDTGIEPTTHVPEVDPGLVPEWTRSLARALQARSELLQGRIRVELADVGVERARSARRASLDLVAAFSSTGLEDDYQQSFEEVFDFNSTTTSVGLEFARAVRNTTAVRAERAARAASRSARLSYDQAELAILTEVRAAVREVHFQSEAVAAALKRVALARRQLEAEQSRYKEGLSTTFQVLEFQRELAQALSAEAAARAGYAKSLARLGQAEGVLGEE